MDKHTAELQTRVARSVRLKRLVRAYPEIKALVEENEQLKARIAKIETSKADPAEPKKKAK